MPEKYEAAATYTPAEMVALWTECSARISVSGQSYRIGNREFTAADLQYVNQQIVFWEARAEAADSGMVQTLAKIHRR